MADNIPDEILKERDPSKAIPPLYGALLKIPSSITSCVPQPFGHPVAAWGPVEDPLTIQSMRKPVLGAVIAQLIDHVADRKDDDQLAPELATAFQA